jgi:RNA polymerase sigma-70 factor (ECF subfamily)
LLSTLQAVETEEGRRGEGPQLAARAGGATGAEALRRLADGPSARVEALVGRAREGDRKAFDDLVRLTSPACYSLACRLVGNEHDARDVLQDAYLRAFRSLRRFRGEAAFPTWLHRITVNCAADLLERRRRTAHDVLDDMGDSAVLVDQRTERDPAVAAGLADERERLVDALSKLPAQLRLVVVLRDVYDLPHREIAKELGISQGAAKVRLHRARVRLRECLFAARLLTSEAGATDDAASYLSSSGSADSEPSRPAVLGVMEGGRQ